MLNRMLAYTGYALLTLGSFGAAELYPTDLTKALPPNLLSGFLVVVFIDSLIRLAEDRRLRPMQIITHKNNGFTRARLKSLFWLMRRAAIDMSIIEASDLEMNQSVDIPIALAHFANEIPLRHRLKSGEELLTLLWQEQQSTMEMLTKSLDQYGIYQDPEIAALLAEISQSSLFTVIDGLYRSGFTGTNPIMPTDMWLEVINWHNLLAGKLDRESLRLGLNTASP